MDAEPNGLGAVEIALNVLAGFHIFRLDRPTIAPPTISTDPDVPRIAASISWLAVGARTKASAPTAHRKTPAKNRRLSLFTPLSNQSNAQGRRFVARPI
jgi:hypothetical protein